MIDGSRYCKISNRKGINLESRFWEEPLRLPVGYWLQPQTRAIACNLGKKGTAEGDEVPFFPRLQAMGYKDYGDSALN